MYIQRYVCIYKDLYTQIYRHIICMYTYMCFTWQILFNVEVYLLLKTSLKHIPNTMFGTMWRIYLSSTSITHSFTCLLKAIHCEVFCSYHLHYNITLGKQAYVVLKERYCCSKQFNLTKWPYTKKKMYNNSQAWKRASCILKPPRTDPDISAMKRTFHYYESMLHNWF